MELKPLGTLSEATGRFFADISRRAAPGGG